MHEIGTYHNRRVVWIEYSNLLKGIMPKDNWVCLATSSSDKPDLDNFDKFTRKAIQNGLLEFKGHGIYGELLHDCFDETIVKMEVMENHTDLDIMTTWHNKQSYADAFWQCFHATCLPDSADFYGIKVVCTDLDGINRSQDLITYIGRFKDGWLP